MTDRTLVVSATNLLSRGYLVVPTDRRSRAGDPVNALFAVARAIHRALAFKLPRRAIAIVGQDAQQASWPADLVAQLEPLPELLRGLGLTVVAADSEVHTVASYAQAAREAGEDVVIVGVDKRFAQLVGDRSWWYDANKDLRYTPEIVEKRFQVPPARVAEWLALVGDEDQLPGIKGIGAKGATSLIAAHPSIEAALSSLESVEGRLAKALRAAGEEVARQLARARLDSHLPLPTPLDALGFKPPSAASLNERYGALGFVELLAAGEAAAQTPICRTESELAAALASFGGGTLTLHALMDDERSRDLAGIALSSATEDAVYVPRASDAWPALCRWLEDPSAPKQGHDLIATRVALQAMGLRLSGIVGDSAHASHLTQPSNWAPHDLPIVAKHALGRALVDDEGVRGVGRAAKGWSALPVERAADVAGERARASAVLWRELSSEIEPRLLGEYLELSDTLVRMEQTGLLLDSAALDRAEREFSEIEVGLEREIGALAGRSFNINSSKQLGDVLFVQLKLPIVSHTKTGWSTANEALERIEHAHPIVGLVLRWRALRRLRDSWIATLRRAVGADGRVRSRFHPARSFSGRLVNTDPDLGRVPGRTAEMAMIRRAFVAPPGAVLMSVDFGQLGLYVLAHLTKDPSLVEPLRQRADMHRLTAAAVLDVAPEAISYDQRQLGKIVNFATFAGQGASALGMQLGVSPEEARALVARFDRHYAKVRKFQDEQLQLAKERGYIVTLAGRRWPIGGLESLDPMLRGYADRLARRATHEGSVCDVSRRALLDADRALRREGMRTVPVLQVLDEVLFEVPEEELERAARVCADAMRGAFELEVPLIVGVEAGKTWADLAPLAT
jgi:DNA polymerase-1